MLTELRSLRACALRRAGLMTARWREASMSPRASPLRIPGRPTLPRDPCSRRAPDLHQRPALALSRPNDELALVASVRFGLGGLGPLAGAADCPSGRGSRQRGPGANGPWPQPSAAESSRISNPAFAVFL